MGFYSAIKYDIFYKANSWTSQATQNKTKTKKRNEQTNKQKTHRTKIRKENGILSFAVEWMEVERTYHVK